MQQPPRAPYGFMPPQGYPPPQKDNSWRVALLIGAAVAAVLIPVFACGVVFSLRNQQQLVATAFTPTAVPAAQTPLATSTLPDATATSVPAVSGPQPIFDSTLGGTPNDFTAAFGDPATQGVWDTSIDGHDAEIHADPAPSQYSRDGQLHIYIVSVLGDTVWSSSTSTSIAKRFLPKDAKHIKDVNASNGARDHIYSSASLKATFAASIFTNDSLTKQVTPGYLSYQCFNFSTYSECDITVGTHD